MRAAPIRPRRNRHQPLADRAQKIRRALAFGPLPMVQLRRVCKCSQYALYKTLRTMPDITKHRSRFSFVYVRLVDPGREEYSERELDAMGVAR